LCLPGILALAALAAPPAADAGQTAKVPRVGILSPIFSAASPQMGAFREGLRALGYIEGQNVILEFRTAEGRFERLPDLAVELIRLKVDVIVTGGPPAPKAAKQATSTIPIVFAVEGDPVAEGLVASLAQPGGAVTGLSSLAPELVGKQLELLREAAPSISRVAVLQNPDDQSHPGMLRQAEAASRALGVRLQVLQARSPAEIDAAFTAIARQRADSLLVLRDPLFLAQRTRTVALAAKSRLPAVYGLREEAEAGGLMSYGANLAALYRRAAAYVDKILKGAKPADLPVEQPMRFELVVNLKTAKALGLSFPPSILIRADQVIQ
jgi:putative ABC transport system substrate-binding protein